ncbi:hypothetical protein PENTCL1PPCAC_7765, partial [Pristionchus entomophagus]
DRYEDRVAGRRNKSNFLYDYQLDLNGGVLPLKMGPVSSMSRAEVDHIWTTPRINLPLNDLKNKRGPNATEVLKQQLVEHIKTKLDAAAQTAIGFLEQRTVWPEPPATQIRVFRGAELRDAAIPRPRLTAARAATTEAERVARMSKLDSFFVVSLPAIYLPPNEISF